MAARGAALACALLRLAAAQTPGAGENKMTFSMPELSEEEQGSQVVPDEFKCDACKAVAYQLTRALDGVKPKPRGDLKAEGKQAVMEQAARLAEAVEGACARETYHDYGIKSGADGKGKRLDGPGIVWDAPGMKAGGGKWPPRLQAICGRLVEEHGEEAGLADLWRAGGLPGICDADCGSADSAPRKRRRKKPPRPAAHPSPALSEQDNGAGPRGGGAAKTGLEELPPPPYSCQPVTRENWTALVMERPQERKFAVVLFHDVTPKSSRATAVMELAARQAKKAKEKGVRRAFFGRYDSKDGDTHGYNFGMGHLPKLLLFRAGYRNPKTHLAGFNGPDEIIDWLRDEVLNQYMKDDPEAFPRGEQIKSEL